MLSEYFSTWNLIRVSGFLSYFLLTASLAFGFLQAFSSIKNKKADLLLIHQTSGWIGLLVIMFHMIMLFMDQYVHYSLLSILVPFYAENESFSSGLGTLSFYLFLVVIGSSDFFMRILGRTPWRKIHLLAVPAWILMSIHGILIGTDTQEVWASSIYIGSIGLIIVLGVAKAMEAVSTNNNKTPFKKTQ